VKALEVQAAEEPTYHLLASAIKMPNSEREKIHTKYTEKTFNINQLAVCKMYAKYAKCTHII